MEMKLEMRPWYQANDEVLRFKFGLECYQESRDAAKSCGQFIPDDEDEQIDDVLVSCYNCMKRRWLVDSLECVGRM